MNIIYEYQKSIDCRLIIFAEQFDEENIKNILTCFQGELNLVY